MASIVKDLSSPYDWQRRMAEGYLAKVKAWDGFTISDGVMRWDTNGRCVPTEWAELAEYAGLPVDMERHERISKAELRGILASYRKAQANRSPEARAEELYEMRAAFGPGQRVVNIITGETTIT